jgi:hypothetical protein
MTVSAFQPELPDLTALSKGKIISPQRMYYEQRLEGDLRRSSICNTDYPVDRRSSNSF